MDEQQAERQELQQIVLDVHMLCDALLARRHPKALEQEIRRLWDQTREYVGWHTLH